MKRPMRGGRRSYPPAILALVSVLAPPWFLRSNGERERDVEFESVDIRVCLCDCVFRWGGNFNLKREAREIKSEPSKNGHGTEAEVRMARIEWFGK